MSDQPTTPKPTTPEQFPPNWERALEFTEIASKRLGISEGLDDRSLKVRIFEILLLSG